MYTCGCARALPVPAPTEKGQGQRLEPAGQQGRVQDSTSPFLGAGEEASSSLLAPGMSWVRDRQGGQTRFAHLEVGSQKPEHSPCSCRACRREGWGVTYHAGGEACVAPEDDPGCAQGGALANGGDEIHLWRQWSLGAEAAGRRAHGWAGPSCSDLVTFPQPRPPLSLSDTGPISLS